MGLPQHFLQDDVLKGYERMAAKARERGIDLAVHTHVNNARFAHPLVARAVGKLLDMGYRDVRNQGRAAARVNTTTEALLSSASRSRSRAHHAVLLLYVRHDPERRALAPAIHEAQTCSTP